ncbi:MAG: aspartyl-tRNA(Asn)/glutamyl-tRNA(Gln) amidotransferase subunit A [Alphaproteobacteria bacterium]|jgi:aspartyl-tRNA(Asn)/glutamyl-tRNA(Gln) amidotransferase subunit A
MDLHFLTIAEMAQRIESKELSPVTLVEALLSRIDAINPQLDAFVTLMGEQALDAARQAEAELEAGQYRGPLHGIPFGLKDIYNSAGVLTSGHSRTAQDHIPDEDATTTARLRAAGGVLLGKLATHEFAHGGPSFDLPWPPARNPWNRDHQTGGSSSGSGAAVAAGLLPGALGSDTGGSIRNPAAWCGLVGLKPTYGLVSRHGVMPNSYTFDHCGPLTWTVEDCAIMLQVLAGHDPKDPASVKVDIPDYRAALSGGVKGLKIGVVRHFWEEDLPANDKVRAAMEASIAVLQDLGAVCEETRMEPMQNYNDTKIVIAESELFSVHRKELMKNPGDFGGDFLARVLPACLLNGADYVEAQRRRRMQMDRMAPLYEKFDILLTAGPYGPAPTFETHNPVTFWRKPSIATPFNVTGGPALVLCNGFSGSGLPLSMQFVGRPFDETTVLRAANAYEKATPFRNRRPELKPGLHPERPQPFAPAIPAVTLDADMQAVVLGMAKQAGLTLNEAQQAVLFEAAPDVFAMADRLRQPITWWDEPGNTFNF